MYQADLVAISKALELCGSTYDSFSIHNHSMALLIVLSNPNGEDPLIAKISTSRDGTWRLNGTGEGQHSLYGNKTADIKAKESARLV